jgi:ubiquitin
MTNTAIQATGIAGAAQAFESLLAGPPSDTETTQNEGASETAPVPEEEETIVGEDVGDETAAEQVDDPDDEAAAEEGDPESAEPEVQLVTVKIDGKTEQVPLEEAIKGYQRNADYSRKAQALAEDRKGFEAERMQVTQERQQYAQLLTALQQQLQTAQPQEPDWQRLYETDPVEWVRQREVWRDRQERMTAAQFEQQRLQVVQQQEQQAALAKMVQDGRQKLTEAIPDWKDSKRWEADRQGLLEYGQTIGFSPEELNQAYDPRAVVALYKAMKYDALMARKPQAAPPKGPKVAPAGNASTAPKAKSEITRAKQRLAQTGRVQDAAALFESFLD